MVSTSTIEVAFIYISWIFATIKYQIGESAHAQHY